ncbi:hypothetical protein MPSEU_000129200 [Mayamaea pseudoterrestris]|nr:hypothetical protein MPSEU_000129200 [Mayamaea pseudoterrestris]
MVHTRHQETKHERTDEEAPVENEPVSKQARRGGSKTGGGRGSNQYQKKPKEDEREEEEHGRRGSNQYQKKPKDHHEEEEEEEKEEEGRGRRGSNQFAKKPKHEGEEEARRDQGEEKHGRRGSNQFVKKPKNEGQEETTQDQGQGEEGHGRRGSNQYQKKPKSEGKQGGRGRRGSNQYQKKPKNEGEEDRDEPTEMYVNRLPVLALWTSVVSECLGFSKEEAYTYGDWVAGTLSHANERQREQYRAKIKESTILDDTGDREASIVDADHVQIMGSVNIPVMELDGNLVAMKNKQVIDPGEAQQYLESVFGDNLETAYNAMMKVAKGIKPDELRMRSYELYEQFRPEWKGWGVPGRLELEEIEIAAEYLEGEGDDDEDEEDYKEGDDVEADE